MFNDTNDPLHKEKNRDYRELRDLVIVLLERSRRLIYAELRKELADRKQFSDTFWQEMRDYWEIQIMAMFVGMASTAAEVSLGADGMPAVDIAELNQPITSWAREYAGALVTGITETTRAGIGNTVAGFFETPGMTIGDLIDQIDAGHLFSPARSEMIAVTEVTRAYAEGQQMAWDAVEQDYAVAVDRIWNTNADDLVCLICQPRHMRPLQPDWEIPAHPRCRCWLTQRIRNV